MGAWLPFSRRGVRGSLGEALGGPKAMAVLCLCASFSPSLSRGIRLCDPRAFLPWPQLACQWRSRSRALAGPPHGACVRLSSPPTLSL